MISTRRQGRLAASPLASLSAMVLAACSLEPVEAPAPPPESAPSFEVSYSGCARVHRGPICAVRAGDPVTLWIEVEDASTGRDSELEIELEGPVASGQLGLDFVGGRVDLVLGNLEDAPEGLALEGSALEVTVRRGRGPGGATTWRLPLIDHHVPDWLREARDLGQAGDFDGARRISENVLATESLESGEAQEARGEALGILARVDLRTGERERAIERLRAASEAWRRAGVLSQEILEASVLAYLLLERRDLVAARMALETLPDAQGDGESRYLASYYRGLAASKAGDVRGALRELAAAQEVAERLGLPARRRLQAGQLLARELQKVSNAEAAEAFEALLADHGALEGRDSAQSGTLPPCDTAQLLNNRAWALLLNREGLSSRAAADPKPLLERALGTFDAGCPAHPGEADNVRLNLALAHLQEGDARSAAARLAEIDGSEGGGDSSLEVRLWRWDVEARLLLARGDAGGALELYRRLGERSRDTASPEAQWRAAFGRARALEALRETDTALAAYAAAEAILDREILGVPMHRGRDRFAAQRGWAVRRYLDLLLREGLEQRALVALRRARARVLRSLRGSVRLANLTPAQRQVWDRTLTAYQRERAAVDAAAAQHWQLSEKELRQRLEQGVRSLRKLREQLDVLLASLGEVGTSESPATMPSGEALLAFHPLPQGWVGLAATVDGIVARRLEVPDEVAEASPEMLAAALLEPFETVLESARRVRILDHGPLRQVDFHALPFQGHPLVAKRAVAYALDLPRPEPDSEARPLSLVVGDPTGDLPRARKEARRLVESLEIPGRAGLGEPRILLGEEASGPEIRALVAGSRLFHYAGHAVFAGWDSYLPLARGGRLTVDDALALERAPDWVILSGCETGRGGERAPIGTIGLAHAFLAAGSRAVVAATRPVSDREAGELMDAFYRELLGADAPDPVEALRRAQTARLDEGKPSSDWASFRIFVP